MKKIFKYFFSIILIIFLTYIIGIYSLKFLIQKGYTNSKSDSILLNIDNFFFKKISLGKNKKNLLKNITGDNNGKNIIGNNKINNFIFSNQKKDYEYLNLQEQWKKYSLFVYLKGNNLLTKGLFNYLDKNLEDLIRVYSAYDYLNGTKSVEGILDMKKKLDNKKEFKSTKKELENEIEIIKKNINKNLSKEKLWFSDNFQNDKGFQFVFQGNEKRKTIMSTIRKESKKLNIDPDIVISSLLGEQVRIATKGYRGKLKNIILKGTPTLFLSSTISLGIGGIKIPTARKIVKDAIELGHGNDLKNHLYLNNDQWFNVLTKSDYYQGLYPTYLTKNIITRRKKKGVDISKNPGVVGTLYNMGNPLKKEPHNDPKIGGSIIKVGNKDYVYGGISMSIYWYLKIYK